MALLSYVTVVNCLDCGRYVKVATGFASPVNYEEKMYAAGKFPGGFMKREGRPSADATLTAL